jgi:aminoglycoside phosphotransferase (APT) family kinase protein
MNVAHREPTKKSDDMEEESTEETDDCQQTVQLDRVLLVKMPKVMPKDKDWKKLLDQISYEKEVLANLRTVGCAYIPKYYHSIQEKYEHRPFLLMDYVPGSTLSE